MHKTGFISFVLMFCFLTYQEATGTHIRAADIIVTKVDCSTLKYKITLRVYVNTTSSTPVGGFSLDDGHISFGDGSVGLIPQTAVTMRPDLGTNIGIALIELEHTYSSEGFYKINYFERDRSSGIINIAQAFDVAYSTYVRINAIASDCNAFPILNVSPLDRACRGVIFFHNPGATDADGDSISYELSTPSKNSNDFVDGFIEPDDPRFYTNFSQGNEARNGEPVFTIDEETGLIKWDAPGMQGEYNIAFKILEWRKNTETGEFFLMSETIRDMQIVVVDCANKRPVLIVPQNLCVEAGKLIQIQITGSDPENHPVKVEVFSSILEGGPETLPATYSPVSNDFQSSPVKIDFEWQTHCIHVRDQSYQVVFKITDSPPFGPNLVTFETWNIRIIAPAPTWVNVVPDLVNRTAELEWDPYTCMNADKVQIWRKVGSSPFTPDVCTAGLSIYKGYQLIKELTPDNIFFYDDNDGKKLSVAAQYCYRLVAVFKGPAGGKSYVSAEFCMEPILADAPVITNVSVVKTDTQDGLVQVKWLVPFDISATQYPGPYEYEIYRGTGFQSSENLVNVSGRLQNLSDLRFDDDGVNSRDSVYNYRIVLYSNTQSDDAYFPIDTSSVASTVRLSAVPAPAQISLTWEADVPWSNVASSDPWHYIYRGDFKDGEEQLTLIDSVDVSENGFEYIDSGQFNGQPLEDDVMYCYAVITKGTYGNNAIPLLLNRSQMVCLYNENNLPPCKPVLQVEKTDCDNFLRASSCSAQDFVNTLHWEVLDTEGCRQDIVSYNIYQSEGIQNEFSLMKEGVHGMTYQDENLNSFAKCYRIQAVDAKGNLSALSEADCNENCPYYNLPNVFTPNGDGCNDLFSAFNGFENTQNPNCSPEPGFCPSFVNSVTFRVLNRWGRIIYEYQSDTNHSIYIDWNGKDKNGDLLESGVYFYVADVKFQTVDPENSSRRLKGWVHLIR